MLKENKMNVIKATYGGVDCTIQIQSKINGDKLIIRSNNDIIGDTQPGIVKYLEIEIEHEGVISNYKIQEHNLFVFPKSNHNKLGIFYSNNNTPSIYPAIDVSLKSIKKAAEGKADILTCMWQRQLLNPFPEFIAWTHTSSHLNQLLQVMQLLYQAREISKYEYVSFLEHDVLYPKGYFDFPDFEEGIVMTNMNYMGINTDGFQPLGQRDEPFHQMTMRFDEAIKHCESILANALIRNSGLIEPQNLIRKQWNCINPSIHINHGKHFTSHFNVYTKNTYVHHEYWGEHKDVWPF
jgi:hypothetical protein